LDADEKYFKERGFRRVKIGAIKGNIGLKSCSRSSEFGTIKLGIWALNLLNFAFARSLVCCFGPQVILAGLVILIVDMFS